MEEQDIEKIIKAMSLEELQEYAVKVVKERNIWQRSWSDIKDENARLISKLTIIRETMNL